MKKIQVGSYVVEAPYYENTGKDVLTQLMNIPVGGDLEFDTGKIQRTSYMEFKVVVDDSIIEKVLLGALDLQVEEEDPVGGCM